MTCAVNHPNFFSQHQPNGQCINHQSIGGLLLNRFLHYTYINSGIYMRLYNEPCFATVHVSSVQTPACCLLADCTAVFFLSARCHLMGIFVFEPIYWGFS